VVVSVTVEGSAGPVKAMVWLSSIREAIAAVVKRYAREGSVGVDLQWTWLKGPSLPPHALIGGSFLN
jgi:hypothetical protein